MIDNLENREFCALQMERVSGNAYFDNLSEEFIEEVMEALLDAADCQEQAREIITDWHRAGNKRYPTPGDIYAAAKAMERPTEAPTPIPSCDQCRDTPGFVQGERIVRGGLWDGEKRSCSDHCTCPLGKAKRAAFEELKRQPTPRPDFVNPTKQRIEEILENDTGRRDF